MGSCIFHSIVILILLIAIVIGIVAVVAGQAGCAVQRLGMAVPARGSAVVDSAPALIGNARMRPPIARRPVIYRMAGRTIQAEQPGMIDRVAVTAGAGRGQSGKLA